MKLPFSYACMSNCYYYLLLRKEEVQIVVTDITGKEVLRKKCYTNTPIQLQNHLMPGHYVVTAQTKDRQMKETLIVR